MFTNYLFVILSFLIALILSKVIIPKIMAIAVKRSLYDQPDERKWHSGHVSQLGGLSFVPSIFFAVALTMSISFIISPNTISDIERIGHYAVSTFIKGETDNSHLEAHSNIGEYGLFFCGAMLLFFTGVKDDLVGVRYRHKFRIQIVASILFVLSGLYFNNLYGLFDIHKWSVWLGVPVSLIFIVYITNAINLIDGIDGLASCICLLTFFVLGYLFMSCDLWIYSMISFAGIGVLIPFIYYNVFGNADKGTKIFMGDTGSLTLGYIIACLIIRYACIKPDMPIPTDRSLVFVFSTLIVPMFDVVRVMIQRLRHNKNIFSPDRNHIHHKLMKLGLTPRETLVVLILLTIFLGAINYILTRYFVQITITLIIDIILWTVLNIAISKKIQKLNGTAQ